MHLVPAGLSPAAEHEGKLSFARQASHGIEPEVEKAGLPISPCLRTHSPTLPVFFGRIVLDPFHSDYVHGH
jgi:hypothetical protein